MCPAAQHHQQSTRSQHSQCSGLSSHSQSAVVVWQPSQVSNSSLGVMLRRLGRGSDKAGRNSHARLPVRSYALPEPSQSAVVEYTSATCRRRLWIVSAREPVRTSTGRTTVAESCDPTNTIG